MFNIVYAFLQRGADALIYRDSVRNIDFSEESGKFSSSR